MTITIISIAAGLAIGFLCLVIYLQRKTISSLERIVIKFQDDIGNVFKENADLNSIPQQVRDDEKDPEIKT